MKEKDKDIIREARKRGIKITLDKAGELKDIELKDKMFFLPENFKELKGKWVLYVKKGLLIRHD